MPEPVPHPRVALAPLASGGTVSAAPRTDGLSVGCPAWEALPGVVHGTTTRAASPEPGKPDFFTVLARARQRGALPAMPTLGAEQVHGDAIGIVRKPLWGADRPAGLRWDPQLIAAEFPATDALVTTLPGLLLVIQTADCLPTFYVDAEAGVIGLAHCGWRGLRADLTGQMVATMAAAHADPARLRAWLGPCIQPASYEVGPALVAEFAAAFPGAPVSPNGTHLDLPAIARWQLERAGLRAAHIIDSHECTRTQPARYHSWRGQGEDAGRILSYLALGLPE